MNPIRLLCRWLGVRPAVRDEQIRLHGDKLARAFRAEAERLVPEPEWGDPSGPYLRWPDGCDNPPCDIEDRYQCTAHRPHEPGKHRLGSSQTRGDGVVILATVTDLAERRSARVYEETR